MVEIEITGVEETFAKLRVIGDALHSGAIIKEATHYAHEQALKGAKPHRRSGKMEDAIEMRVKNNEGVVWIDDRNLLVDWKGKRVNYAAFVLFGSKPHDILPKKRKALRWQIGSTYHFARSVRHPGYKGDNFLERAAQRTFARLHTIAERIIDDAIH